MLKKITPILSLLCFLLVPSEAFSLIPSDVKPANIKGFVKDSLSGKGLIYAHVQLLNAKDSSLVKGGMTNDRGAYQIIGLKTGTYLLKASYMGYQSKLKQVVLNGGDNDVSFGLRIKNATLNEVTIGTNKSYVEKGPEKTTVNVRKDLTTAGGSAIDVLKTLPSVDVDMDGNIQYRGSDKVTILINGEPSELVKSIEQIPADQIAKVELINNPSAKYDAQGVAGIINIVLKAEQQEKRKTSLRVFAGYPQTAGASVGYSQNSKKVSYFVNGGLTHKTKFQTKEHWRDNVDRPSALDYYQFDRQDQNLNNAMLSAGANIKLSQKQRLNLSLTGSHKFNSADRDIHYQTHDDLETVMNDAWKEIDSDVKNYSLDGVLKHSYLLGKKRKLSTKLHYSHFDQMHEMNNAYAELAQGVNPELQNTQSQQLNKRFDVALHYVHPVAKTWKLESGLQTSFRDLLNDFSYEWQNNTGTWLTDTVLSNTFHYLQYIHAGYLNMNGALMGMPFSVGLRAEYTQNRQDGKGEEHYLDWFPSMSLTRKLNTHHSLFVAFSRRINRPTIKMLNPFSDEYADLLNMHRGNPSLQAEYVNGVELGERFVYKKFSGAMSVYYRHIDAAIARVKAATNDSALMVTFMNLNQAKLLGGEFLLSYRPYKWWSMTTSANLFYTELQGTHGKNQIQNSRFGWNGRFASTWKLKKGIGIQLSGYYKSKLPSSLGTYQARYYMDMAVSKSVLKKRAKLVFKVSDVMNTYRFGLDLEALDVDGFTYTQTNRRKNESQYFILSFVYNIDGKQEAKKQKTKFFLEDFAK